MIIYLDTETTGLRPGIDNVIELSIIEGNGGLIFDKYFKPTRVVDFEDATAVHGIKYKDLENVLPIYFYQDEIQNILDDADKIIGYNVEFDLNMLKGEGFHIRDPFFRVIDVMPIFASYYGDWSDKYNSFKFKSLEFAAAHFGFQFHAHDSYEDAVMTKKVYDAMLMQTFND